MKLTATKSNGTVIFKEVDSNDNNYIEMLKSKGWKEVKSPATSKKSTSKKSNKK